jgi:predicted secreted protein with PEFG-CTERM motif
MKIQGKTVFPLMTIFTIVMMFSMSSAFAESVSVSAPQGTSVPGCETTNECFIPHEVTVNVGDTVIWSNDDSAAHTVTAGSAGDGPSGVFDSSLFMAGTTFSHTFESEGEVPYFCMVHPWMQGIVFVGTTMAKEPIPAMPEITKTEPSIDEKVKITLNHEISSGKITTILPDIDANSLIIGLETTNNGELTVTLPRDIIDSTINNEDDVFFVLVDGEEVTFEETATSTDRTLTIQYPGGAEEIEIIGTFVIPEFGTIAVMILVVAIISVISISAKSRLSLMPKL